ncbi:MAG: DUF447 domain-containing protein [Candidatus Wukongarchaeota archaeon]|nr:DUF447 family protein [Candidatus Wukongarchaeota archaeon]MDO8128921.1 DUF447 family protein [Candidatus Wukongarchaeota archaeon]
MEKILEVLDFQEDFIYETLITTYHENGIPNVAPMGVFTPDLDLLIIRPYEETDTYKNLRQKNCCVVNLTQDLLLFAKAALEKNVELEPDEFGEGFIVDAPVLKKADAWLEIETKYVGKKEGRAEFEGKIVTGGIKNPFLKPLNRGFFSTLETIIHATRVRVHEEVTKNFEEAQKLRKLIDYYSNLVNRVTSSSSKEKSIINYVLSKI